MAVAYRQDDGTLAFCSLLSSVPEGAEFVEQAILPQDEWHEAFDIVGDAVVTDLPKAKSFVHNLRRIQREELMTPLDNEERFMSTSPARKGEIQTDKQTILDTNADIQTAINLAADEDELRIVMVANNL